jgi:hypothetical protein
MQQPKSHMSSPPSTNDLFLYALFARIALNNHENIEFETKFDKATNTIELVIQNSALPLFNQITGMQRGPKFQAYINWLIGSQTLTTTSSDASKDPNFISSTLLEPWFGATPTTINDKFLLNLPTEDASVVGYNLKTNETFLGKLIVSLVWMFIGGSNSSFDIRTTANISDSEGNSPNIVVQDNNISTLNLIEGDIRETELIDTGNIVGNSNIISLLINRNFVGSPDPTTEAIGIIGLKVQLING